jgi:hypothetical protein
MKKTSWWKTNHLWDSLCASWEEGMSWVLRVVGKGFRLRRRPQVRRPRRLCLELDALEPRFLPTLYLDSFTPPTWVTVEGQ